MQRQNTTSAKTKETNSKYEARKARDKRAVIKCYNGVQHLIHQDSFYAESNSTNIGIAITLISSIALYVLNHMLKIDNTRQKYFRDYCQFLQNLLLSIGTPKIVNAFKEKQHTYIQLLEINGIDPQVFGFDTPAHMIKVVFLSFINYFYTCIQNDEIPRDFVNKGLTHAFTKDLKLPANMTISHEKINPIQKITAAFSDPYNDAIGWITLYVENCIINGKLFAKKEDAEKAVRNLEKQDIRYIAIKFETANRKEQGYRLYIPIDQNSAQQRATKALRTLSAQQEYAVRGTEFAERLNAVKHVIDEAGPDSGRTALHWAGAKGNHNFFAKLVAAGADPNRLDKKGETPAQLLKAAVEAENVNMKADANKNLSTETPAFEETRKFYENRAKKSG